MDDDAKAVLKFARSLFKTKVDWVTFFKSLFGRDGLVTKTFTDLDELSEFEQTNEYVEVQSMLAKLRDLEGSLDGSPAEAIRVITIRLPESVHLALRDEAYARRTTMNKLCISKLLQIVDQQFVPSD